MSYSTFHSSFLKKYGFEPLFEDNMTNAVKNYFMLGLHPGSCTTAIIAGNFDHAKASAHPNLLKTENNSSVDNITRLFYTYREFLGPTVLEYGTDFPGIKNVPDYEAAMIFLECPLMN